MDKKIGNPNAGFSPVSRKVKIPIRLIAVSAILLSVLVLLQSCSPTAQPDGTPSPQPDIPSDPTSRPENAVMCGNPGEYVCTGLHDYTITLTNVPGDVAPYLLPISADEESQLRDAPKDGVGCVVSIAGNLVFYDNNNKLFTSFPDPVTLELHYTDNDEQFRTIFNKKVESTNIMTESLIGSQYDDKLVNCAGNLKANGVDKIELVPIYLYTPMIDGYSGIHIWKPFQNFSINEVDKTMTIEFLYWGDQQVGGGTRP